MLVRFVLLLFVFGACATQRKHAEPPAPKAPAPVAAAPAPSSPSALSSDQTERIQCWKKAHGIGDVPAAVVCASSQPDTAMACLRKLTSGFLTTVGELEAAYLCTSNSPDESIACYRDARKGFLKAVPQFEAALLCSSDHREEALQCFRKASWVEDLSAAILCSQSGTKGAVFEQVRRNLQARKDRKSSR